MDNHKEFISWLAGFWEGEGFLVRPKESNGYRIGIVQAIREERTVEYAMRKIHEKFKGQLREFERKPPRRKAYIRWYLAKREDVIYFLKKIYPYCQMRKKDIEDALKYFETHPLLTRWSKTLRSIDVEMAKRLRREGKEYREIAKIMEVTHTRIFRKLNNKTEYPYSGHKKKGGENLANVHKI